jgi:hypothetical protein
MALLKLFDDGSKAVLSSNTIDFIFILIIFILFLVLSLGIFLFVKYLRLIDEKRKYYKKLHGKIK